MSLSSHVPRLSPRPLAVLCAFLALALPLSAQDGSQEVTQGSLIITDPTNGEPSRLPLRHTDVLANVSGTEAEVTVTQTFANRLGRPLEAVYVFPLPDRAAVDDMSIRIGDRLLVGEIHRRAEARQIYERARAEGRLTGLLDQERPNIFTQRVANIPADAQIEVVIHYVEDLALDHGTWRLVFPMVVGPRYIPGSPTGRSGPGWSPDTTQVPDASRITPPVLRPGERSGHDIALAVELAPGFPIHELRSSSHQIEVRRSRHNTATVRLSPRDTIPNKDFVLTWRTAGADIEPAVLAHRTGDIGYLTLLLQPPAAPAPEQVVPREVVFVLDTSGSMSGEPIAACKQLVRKALRGLRDDDTFRLIRFAGAADQLDPEALSPTRANLERALSYLDGMRGGGGTEMLTGVRAALEAPKDPYRLRMVVFLTDGYIGNETQIIAKVSEALGDARIFSFGIGSSVNRYLLDRLAEAGRGVAEYLRPGESPDALVARFFQRISTPVFTQLELDWGGLDVEDVEPAALPDLFAGQPLMVHARFRKVGRATVTLHGWAGQRRLEVSTRVHLPRREAGNASQAKLWARARIARLEMERARSGNAHDIEEAETLLALEHRLMTHFTSFVVVDRSGPRVDQPPTEVVQPVPMPEGVSYEGVFGKVKAASTIRNARHESIAFMRLGVADAPSAPPPMRQRPVSRGRLVPVPDPSPSKPHSVHSGKSSGVLEDASPVSSVPPIEELKDEAERLAAPPPQERTARPGATAPTPVEPQRQAQGAERPTEIETSNLCTSRLPVWPLLGALAVVFLLSLLLLVHRRG